jgi:hypothetical protein
VLDLLAQRKLRSCGFVRQEEIALADFLTNRFGRAYAQAPSIPPMRAAA